ncbi:MAG: LysM peptidoglycan-binding domain-containing protein [Bradyrhizobiaceae bacterium]|nr:MAG: LysM peptidoglycan-binding domain-containing protein [Bradyrhizobiaceae bacterium]
MFRVVELSGSRHAPPFAVAALIAAFLGGCSADTSTRFSQDGWSNPFESRREATGSVQHNSYPPRELPQYARPQSQPVISAPASYPSGSYSGGSYASSQVTSGGGRGVSSYAPPSNPIETTGTVPPRSVAATGWTREGGTKIIVGTSDTLEIISKRYNVPPAAIMQANGYSGPRMLSPGQQLIIPRRDVAMHAPTPELSAAPATRSAAAMPAGMHVVNNGDTLSNLARRYHTTPAKIARANNLPVTAQLKLGTKIMLPNGVSVASAAPAPVAAPAAPQPVAVAPVSKPVVTAAAEPPQKARVATETKEIEETQSPVKAADATNALPSFRWPVRGRVITGYGAKTNGKQNDGINVAVPEGTPVKAAEDGVVAYSGNELKGYGNLILVRHANGYVTAYAHASELMVKRGDTIKRGQIIAKSGQSGEVSSPQLHFEIRKGSSPVDPLQFLNGA